jgi:hypothetical protein
LFGVCSEATAQNGTLPNKSRTVSEQNPKKTQKKAVSSVKTGQNQSKAVKTSQNQSEVAVVLEIL